MGQFKIEKTAAEWQAQLTPEQYHVCREKGTEMAFTGKYHDCKDPDIYHHACCGTELFDADTKLRFRYWLATLFATGQREQCRHFC